MAEKKNFDGIVADSFNEGYRSEPERVESKGGEPPMPPIVPVNVERQGDETKPLSEDERFLRLILSGDKDAIIKAWKREGRYTFFTSAQLRACIEMKAYEEGCTMTKVIADAFEQYFSAEEKEAAKKRAVKMTVKDLEKEIAKEKKK